jgi:hypothetical protein
LLTPDPDFRPNPERAIYLHGQINTELVDHLTPLIIKLKNQSFDPLTVYIDSVGGDPNLMESILKLLFAGNQDNIPRARVITVTTRQAASAAADLLSSGDYALAYPGASILYHGIRLADLKRPLTHEWSSVLVDYLRERNRAYAMQLGEKIISRFMFRFVVSKAHFKQVRKDQNDDEMSELDCYLALIRDKLSPEGKAVLDTARARYERYDELLTSVIRYETRRKPPTKRAGREALRLKAIVEFEANLNRKNDKWSFEQGGMKSLTDDFFLLTEYLTNYQTGSFKSLCASYGDFLMSAEEKEELKALSEPEREVKKAEKVRPLLFPVWSFFVGFCHALQRGENELTALDAYWLGLIDEVIGEEGLPSLRLVNEYSPDPKGAAEDEKANGKEPAHAASAEAGA